MLPNELPQLNIPKEQSPAPMAMPEVPMEGVPQTSEGRRQILERKLEGVSSRERALNSEGLIQKNRLKEFKTQLIQNLFKLMDGLGIDPNDLESINNFLQQLDTLDPDLRELFEVAFGNLTQDTDVNSALPPSMPLEQEGGLMNRDLSQESLMPRQ